MNKCFVGIDPGMNGAIAIIYPSIAEVISIPINEEEKDIDIWKMLDRLITTQLDDFYSIAYIEKVWKPSKLVRIAGILEGILFALHIKVYRVAPSTWRKEILGNKLATKEDAINYCLENYSDINLLRTERSRIPDHNLAEALCIAEYAKRKHFVSEDQR